MKFFDDNLPEFSGEFDDEAEGLAAERERMLARFEEQLLNDEEFEYDEGEWALLADYASDVDNLYLQNEAITLGLSEFPDSPHLEDRRLLMLYKFSAPENARTPFRIAATRPDATKLVRIYNAFFDWEDTPDDKKDAGKLYNEVCDILFDEDIVLDLDMVESIHIFEEAGALHFMGADIERWEKHSPNKELLWYEYTTIALENALFDPAEENVEKLISEFPYNCLYWMIKARILILKSLGIGKPGTPVFSDNIDEVLGIIDTVLAINPKDMHALKLREKVMEMKEAMTVDTEATVKTFCEGIPDVMTLPDLLDIAEKDTPAARNNLRDWVCREMTFTGATHEPTRQNSFYTLVEALYFNELTDALDFILDIVNSLSDGLCLPLSAVMFLRHIEKCEFDSAEAILGRIKDEYPDKTITSTCMMMATIFAIETGNKVLAMMCNSSIMSHLLELKLESIETYKEYIGDLNPCLLFYLTKNYMAQDD